MLFKTVSYAKALLVVTMVALRATCMAIEEATLKSLEADGKSTFVKEHVNNGTDTFNDEERGLPSLFASLRMDINPQKQSEWTKMADKFVFKELKQLNDNLFGTHIFRRYAYPSTSTSTMRDASWLKEKLIDHLDIADVAKFIAIGRSDSKTAEAAFLVAQNMMWNWFSLKLIEVYEKLKPVELTDASELIDTPFIMWMDFVKEKYRNERDGTKRFILNRKIQAFLHDRAALSKFRDPFDYAKERRRLKKVKDDIDARINEFKAVDDMAFQAMIRALTEKINHELLEKALKPSKGTFVTDNPDLQKLHEAYKANT